MADFLKRQMQAAKLLKKRETLAAKKKAEEEKDAADAQAAEKSLPPSAKGGDSRMSGRKEWRHKRTRIRLSRRRKLEAIAERKRAGEVILDAKEAAYTVPKKLMRQLLGLPEEDPDDAVKEGDDESTKREYKVGVTISVLIYIRPGDEFMIKDVRTAYPVAELKRKFHKVYYSLELRSCNVQRFEFFAPDGRVMQDQNPVGKYGIMEDGFEVRCKVIEKHHPGRCTLQGARLRSWLHELPGLAEEIKKWEAVEKALATPRSDDSDEDEDSDDGDGGDGNENSGAGAGDGAVDDPRASDADSEAGAAAAAGAGVESPAAAARRKEAQQQRHRNALSLLGDRSGPTTWHDVWWARTVVAELEARREEIRRNDYQGGRWPVRGPSAMSMCLGRLLDDVKEIASLPADKRPLQCEISVDTERETAAFYDQPGIILSVDLLGAARTKYVMQQHELVVFVPERYPLVPYFAQFRTEILHPGFNYAPGQEIPGLEGFRPHVVLPFMDAWGPEGAELEVDRWRPPTGYTLLDLLRSVETMLAQPSVAAELALTSCPQCYPHAKLCLDDPTAFYARCRRLYDRDDDEDLYS